MLSVDQFKLGPLFPTGQARLESGDQFGLQWVVKGIRIMVQVIEGINNDVQLRAALASFPIARHLVIKVVQQTCHVLMVIDNPVNSGRHVASPWIFLLGNLCRQHVSG